MGFRTENYHLWETDRDTISINSKSERERWLEIPREEWEQIVAWWTQDLLSRVDTLERERDEAQRELTIVQAVSQHNANAHMDAEARLRAAEEALRALVDVMPYCHVNPNSPRAQEWNEWREAALDRAAAVLAGVQAPALDTRDAARYFKAGAEEGYKRGCAAEEVLVKADVLADTYGRVWAKDTAYYAYVDARAALAGVQAPAGEDTP
jgi:PAS domain-containing protein